MTVRFNPINPPPTTQYLSVGGTRVDPINPNTFNMNAYQSPFNISPISYKGPIQQHALNTVTATGPTFIPPRGPIDTSRASDEELIRFITQGMNAKDAMELGAALAQTGGADPGTGLPSDAIPGAPTFKPEATRFGAGGTELWFEGDVPSGGGGGDPRIFNFSKATQQELDAWADTMGLFENYPGQRKAYATMASTPWFANNLDKAPKGYPNYTAVVRQDAYGHVSSYAPKSKSDKYTAYNEDSGTQFKTGHGPLSYSSKRRGASSGGYGRKSKYHAKRRAREKAAGTYGRQGESGGGGGEGNGGSGSNTTNPGWFEDLVNWRGI